MYKVTNKVNGKIYIGQTIKEFERRKTLHLSRVRKNSNLPIHNAIRKYGEDNFEWVKLELCSNIEELNKREKYWIKKSNSLVPNGYNLQTGGSNDYFFHSETRAKMRENHADVEGESNPMYGKTHSEKTKRKMSKIAKERLKNKEKHPLYGKTHNEETRDKISKSLKKYYNRKNKEE